MTRKRVDENQPDLVRFIRQLGGTWEDLSMVAKKLDGIIGYCGLDQRVEIKNPSQPASKQRLTDDEKIVFENWRGRKPVILKTEDDVFDLFSRMRHDARLLRDAKLKEREALKQEQGNELDSGSNQEQGRSASESRGADGQENPSVQDQGGHEDQGQISRGEAQAPTGDSG